MRISAACACALVLLENKEVKDENNEEDLDFLDDVESFFCCLR
jgi:hypothetical protein